MNDYNNIFNVKSVVYRSNTGRNASDFRNWFSWVCKINIIPKISVFWLLFCLFSLIWDFICSDVIHQLRITTISLTEKILWDIFSVSFQKQYSVPKRCWSSDVILFQKISEIFSSCVCWHEWFVSSFWKSEHHNTVWCRYRLVFGHHWFITYPSTTQINHTCIQMYVTVKIKFRIKLNCFVS